ncbi:hypothetical protein [Halobaculum sp. EA56]|uniref:hypothetical protein n=1 Tax=Halobaculum sp. EA56 TaxID=3421648 RepID=UPI003EBD9974
MAEGPPDDREGGDDADGDALDPFGGDAAERDPEADPAAADPTGEQPDGDLAAGGDEGDAPLGDLAREVARRRRRADDEPDPDADLFEEVDVGDLDEDELWASLSGEGSEAGAVAAGVAGADAATAAASTAADAVDDDVGDTRPEHVLDKREYCQRCPYLSAPPAVECGHEGTDIVELVDAGHFRVRGCPMVTGEGRPGFATGGDVTDDADADLGDGAGDADADLGDDPDA